MSLKLDDTKDLLMQIDRSIKAGRMSFSLLSTDSLGKIKQNELYIDYGNDDNGNPIGPNNNNFPTDGKPIRGKIKLMGPKGPVDLTTVTGTKLHEFINNFLEVSVNKTKDYEPGMWLMLRQNEHGDTGYNESTIEQFYRFIQKNKNELTPYIMQTFKDGKRDVLIPYITSDLVFYDVSKIIEGEGIKNLDDVIKLIYKLSDNVSNSLTANIEAITKKMELAITNLNDTSIRINNTINTLDESIRDVKSQLNDLSTTIEHAKIVSNSAFKNKTVSLKAGEVLVIRKQGSTPDANDTEITPLETPTYTEANSVNTVLKLIYIYHKPTYMSITEIITKKSGSSISYSELENFVNMHNRQSFYRLGDNKKLVDNYKFNENKTVIVNLDSIYKDKDETVIEEEAEETDVNTICTLDIQFVNKFKKEFPLDNSNNWLVGTQKISFFKNDTLMYYHLNIPSGYMLYNMPSTNSRQVNTFLNGYQVKTNTTLVIDVVPTMLSTDISILGDASGKIYNRNILYDDYFSSTEIYDLTYKGKYTERTTKYYTNEYNIGYTPSIEVTNDDIKGNISIIDSRYGLPIFDRNSSERKFFTLRIKHEIYDDNRWDANKLHEFWVTYVVKPNITVELADFNYDIQSLEIIPDSFSKRLTNINNDFTTNNRNTTFGYKLKDGYTLDDINKSKFSIKSTNWYTDTELETLPTLVNSAIIVSSDPSVDIETKRIFNDINIVGIRYQYKDWNPIHNRWENVYEPGNNKRMYIDKNINSIKSKDIGLAHLNTDYTYRNPDKVYEITDNTSLIVVDLLSHKEIHKIVRFIFRDNLEKDLYIAEVKYYVGDGIKTISMTDVNRYLPDNMQINDNTFTQLDIDISSAPIIDIIIKTVAYKVEKPQRIIQFKYHLEGSPNNILANKTVDVTHYDNIISKSYIPSFLQYANKKEMYIDTTINNMRALVEISNHRFIPSGTVVNYDISNDAITIPVKSYGENISIIQIKYIEHGAVSATIPLDAYYELNYQLQSNSINDIIKNPTKHNLRVMRTLYFTTSQNQEWTGNFIIPNAANLDLTKDSSIYDIVGYSSNAVRYSGCHDIVSHTKPNILACAMYSYSRDVVGSGIAGFMLNILRPDYMYNRLIYNWLNRSGSEYVQKATWNANGLMYMSMDNLPIRKLVNDGSNDIASYPDKLTNNIPIIIEFDITTRNKENQNTFYKSFTLGNARYISNPLETFTNIEHLYNRYMDKPHGYINMSDYFICDYPALLTSDINKFITINLQFKNQQEDKFEITSKEFISNIKLINKAGELFNGNELTNAPKIENILGVPRNLTSIITNNRNNSRSVGLIEESVRESNTRQIQVYPNNSGYKPVPKPDEAPKPIEYTPGTVQPESLLSPVIITGEYNNANTYIEIGPGVYSYMPKVASNDIINDSNRLKSSDIIVAQYGSKLSSNIISMAEITQQGIIYIGSNYDIQFTIWSAYLDTLTTNVYKNTNNINDIANFVNRHGDYNTFGLTPYRNTVITRDATVSIPRGLKLTENMTLINGHAGKQIESWNTDVDISNLGLKEDFIIPLRKLSFRSTYIKYDDVRNTIIFPVAYWKPGLILTINLYINNELHIRYRSNVKSALLPEEIRDGIFRFDFNGKINIPVGATVGYIIEAPNYATSNEVKGVIQYV